MWPFKKKIAVKSFQEFQTSYVRPAARDVPSSIATESVCPLCCDILPPGNVSVDYPCCPDCSSEGIDFEVVPLEDFLGKTMVDELNDLLRRWEATDGFLPDYKELKSQRIRHLIARKRV